jgi:hypothetical protein
LLPTRTSIAAIPTDEINPLIELSSGQRDYVNGIPMPLTIKRLPNS